MTLCDNEKWVKGYEGVIVASRELSIRHYNISNVCQGRRKSCGGYGWRYKENE